MADIMVEGLSGTEIIADVLDQIKRKLMYSCDLRDSDSYGQGYSGTIEIHLKLHAMDATPVDMTVNIQPKGESPVSTENVTVTPVEITETVEIPQEEDLEAVRERLKVPELEPEPNEAEESRMPVRLKRKYTRRSGVASLEQTAQGGAVDVNEE
jgi:hypothetical protein